MKEELLRKLQTKIMGRSVYYFQCTDSTNIQAVLAAKNGARHGAVFVAEKQTAGNGRRGRTWESPAGKNLYFSLLLKPDFAPDKAAMLTLVMAVAVARALQKSAKSLGLCLQGTATKDGCGLQAGLWAIKWPNDLVMNGKKICGILTEMSLDQNRIGHVVIGVGINVESQEFASELVDKATSIEAECGQVLSKELLLAEILKSFEELYEIFQKTCDLSVLQAEYEELLVNKDREVCVLDPKGEYRGIARGINATGELLVEREEGALETVYAGEVSVRGIYGYV